MLKNSYIIRLTKLSIFYFLFILCVFVSCNPKVDEKKARYYMDLANIADNNGDYDSALFYYDIALTYYPERASIYYNRGLCYVHFQKYKKAILDFNCAIKYLDTTNINSEVINFYGHRELAQCYFNLGYSQFALDILDKTFNICIDSLTLISDRCYFNLELGNYENAISDGLHLVEMNGCLAFDYKNLGKAYYYINDKKKALVYILECLKITDYDSEANQFAGLIYQELGNIDSSMYFQKRALMIDAEL